MCSMLGCFTKHTQLAFTSSLDLIIHDKQLHNMLTHFIIPNNTAKIIPFKDKPVKGEHTRYTLCPFPFIFCFNSIWATIYYSRFATFTHSYVKENTWDFNFSLGHLEILCRKYSSGLEKIILFLAAHPQKTVNTHTSPAESGKTRKWELTLASTPFKYPIHLSTPLPTTFFSTLPL